MQTYRCLIWSAPCQMSSAPMDRIRLLLRSLEWRRVDRYFACLSWRWSTAYKWLVVLGSGEGTVIKSCPLQSTVRVDSEPKLTRHMQRSGQSVQSATRTSQHNTSSSTKLHRASIIITKASKQSSLSLFARASCARAEVLGVGLGELFYHDDVRVLFFQSKLKRRCVCLCVCVGGEELEKN